METTILTTTNVNMQKWENDKQLKMDIIENTLNSFMNDRQYGILHIHSFPKKKSHPWNYHSECVSQVFNMNL